MGGPLAHGNSFHRRSKRGEWGMMDFEKHINLFILNNLAEIVGFKPVHKPQTKGLTEHGQQI
jgi:hypothetical protein